MNALPFPLMSESDIVSVIMLIQRQLDVKLLMKHDGTQEGVNIETEARLSRPVIPSRVRASVMPSSDFSPGYSIWSASAYRISCL